MTAPALAPLSIVVLGLSITSSWGNGHATTYRALLRALVRRGHEVTFLEREVPWYVANRDMPKPSFCRTLFYQSLDELRDTHERTVAEADLVIVGSFVPDGTAVGRWVQGTARGIVAFYDIDTPVTLAALSRGDCAYLEPDLIPGYDLYLSFTGGPALRLLERRFGAPRARALFCSADPDVHFPDPTLSAPQWDLGYMGTYSPDRQAALDELLLRPAAALPDRRFVVAGPQYPADTVWPAEVERIEHLPPDRHRAFYCAQRYTLNITRADMVRLGHSPSVRLFEATACATPVISDVWEGLDDLFEPGREILPARTCGDVLKYLRDVSENERRAVGARARDRVLSAHTADHRAAELEGFVAGVSLNPLTSAGRI